MKLYRLISTLFILIISLSGCSVVKYPQAIVTGDPLATQAAAQILAQGGTAADAFVTTVLTLTDVEPQASGLGGGFFAVYYNAKDKKVYTLDAREEQPAHLYPSAFWDYKTHSPRIDWITSVSSIGVPGTADGLRLLHDKFGKLDRKTIIKPALVIAENGFLISEYFYKELQEHLELHPWDDLKLGDNFVNKDYARTLKLLSNNGWGAFYQGTLADAIVAESEIELSDLKRYRAVFREPIKYDYKGNYEIYSIGSPSAGALTLYKIFDLLTDGSIDSNEAIVQAYEYRNKFLADADFISTQCSPSDNPDELGTTHIAISDRFGNIISATVTIQSAFGSGHLVPGYGFLLNNELSDFEAQPGHCNSIQRGLKKRQTAIGLTSHGEEASKTFGAKRPRSSMTPLIVFEKDKPVLALGAAGGWTIINSVYETFTNIIDKSMNLEAAINAPRTFINSDGHVYQETDLSFKTAVNAISFKNNIEAYADKRKNGFGMVIK